MLSECIHIVINGFSNDIRILQHTKIHKRVPQRTFAIGSTIVSTFESVYVSEYNRNRRLFPTPKYPSSVNRRKAVVSGLPKSFALTPDSNFWLAHEPEIEDRGLYDSVLDSWLKHTQTQSAPFEQRQHTQEAWPHARSSESVIWRRKSLDTIISKKNSSSNLRFLLYSLTIDELMNWCIIVLSCG